MSREGAVDFTGLTCALGFAKVEGYLPKLVCLYGLRESSVTTHSWK